ncbi:MAG: SAVED domain-containing protein, partial [Actinobacteria bacterium]|nr:SAVED domain-containing protein [Actinomycetota bacterium]
MRSGGRCAICYRDLFASEITWKQVPLGERAHLVGRSTGKRSPRGGDSLPVGDRDEAGNLMLLCGTCHDDLDDPANLDVLTVERLRMLKRAHETWVEQVLSVPQDNMTTVLRMPGIIGSAGVHIDRSTAAASVLASNRIARFPLSPDRTGLEIDLRRVADPNPGNEDYYATCVRQIDQFFDRQFGPAVEDGTIQHVSVFALARWPLLVHLGARLGDKIITDVYQKHRATDQWVWPAGGEDNRFVVDTDAGDD